MFPYPIEDEQQGPAPALRQGPVPILSRGPVGPPTPQQLALMDRQQGMLQRPMIQRPGSALAQEIARMRAMTPDPRKSGTIGGRISSALLPTLFAGLVGGDWGDAAAFGVGSAAFHYNNQLRAYQDTEARIAEAAAGLPQAEAQFDLTQAQTVRNLAEAATAGITGGKSGSPNFQTWVQLGMPGLANPETAGPDEAAKAFRTWAQEYTEATTAPRVVTSPFSVEVVGGGGDVRYSAPGELSERGIEAATEKAGRTAGEAERWKLNEQQYSALVDLNYDMMTSLDSMKRLRAKIASGPETGPASQYKALVQSELQELQSLFSDAVLAKAAQARAAGVTFGAMTIAEWQMLANTVAQLKNNKKANLAIVDALIGKLQRQLYLNDVKLKQIPEGSSSRPTMPEASGTTRPSGSRLIILPSE